MPGVTDVDLVDLDRFANGFPHDVFTRLRAHAPVWWHPPHPKAPGGEGFWVVSRHAETLHVLRDPVTFSSEGAPGRAGGGTTLDDLPRGVGPGVMLNMIDPPRHDAIRGLVNKGFKPSTIAKLEAELRQRTRAIFDAVQALAGARSLRLPARHRRRTPAADDREPVRRAAAGPPPDLRVDHRVRGLLGPRTRPEFRARARRRDRRRPLRSRADRAQTRRARRRHALDRGARRDPGRARHAAPPRRRRDHPVPHAAARRRHRDHAQRDRRRPARADRTPGSVRRAARAIARCCRAPSKRSCAGRARPPTTAAPPRATPCSAASRSARATR